MDRNDIIKWGILYYNNKLSSEQALFIISEYCREKGKENQDINAFINTLAKYPSLISLFVKDAIDYYERKFVICKVFDKPNLNAFNSKQLLLIF